MSDKHAVKAVERLYAEGYIDDLRPADHAETGYITPGTAAITAIIAAAMKEDNAELLGKYEAVVEKREAMLTRLESLAKENAELRERVETLDSVSDKLMESMREQGENANKVIQSLKLRLEKADARLRKEQSITCGLLGTYGEACFYIKPKIMDQIINHEWDNADSDVKRDLVFTAYLESRQADTQKESTGQDDH